MRKLALSLTMVMAMPLTVIKTHARDLGFNQLLRDLNGPPEMSGLKIDEAFSAESFVEVKARGLKDAKFIYINYAFLRDRGYNIPATGFSREQEQALLRDLAFIIPRKTDPESAFDDTTRTFYVDRYGGYGAGGGSGRVGSRNKFQNKGFGETEFAGKPPSPQELTKAFGAAFGFLGSMMGMGYSVGWVVAKVSGWDLPVAEIGAAFTAGLTLSPLFDLLERVVSAMAHSHGGASFHEGFNETVWGELGSREWPEGSSRIAFLIDTGLDHDWGPYREPRILIVRENIIRPAHYMASESGLKKDADAERQRIADLAPKLANAFSALYDGHFGEGTSLGPYLKELSRRIGRQTAALYVQSVMHLISSSNFALDGKILDNGPTTALSGHRPVTLNASPSHNPGPAFQYVIGWLRNDLLLATGQRAESALLPSEEQLQEIMTAAHTLEQVRQFLWLAGVPDELLDSAVNSQEGRDLASWLVVIATMGPKEIGPSIRYKTPRNNGTYNFRQVAGDLIENVDIGTTISLAELKQAFEAFFAFLHSRAERAHGLSELQLRAYMRAAVQVRNRERTDLFRGPKQWWRLHQIFARFRARKGDRREISNFIASMISGNTRDHGLKVHPFSVILQEWTDPQSGVTLRREFNALGGRYELVILSDIIREPVIGLDVDTLTLLPQTSEDAIDGKTHVTWFADVSESILNNAAAINVRFERRNEVQLLSKSPTRCWDFLGTL